MSDVTITIPRELADRIHDWMVNRGGILEGETMSPGWANQVQGSDDDGVRFLGDVAMALPNYIGCECTNGYLWDQTYGECEPPPNWVCVQACDLCRTFDDDRAAAAQASADRRMPFTVQPGHWYDVDGNITTDHSKVHHHGRHDWIVADVSCDPICNHIHHQ